jgi:hypothetical protein
MAVGAVSGGYKYTVINTSSTTTVMNGSGGTAIPPNSGTFGGMVVSNPGTTWRIQVYDGPVAAGDPILDITPTSSVVIPIPCQLEAGLTVVTSGGTPGSLTVYWV